MQALLTESSLAELVRFMRTEGKLTPFREDLERADPAAEVGIRSVNVGRKAEPKLDLHLGDVLELEARELGPGLVGVGVVVKELVGEHEGGDEQAELAAILTAKTRVLGLEPVNVEEREDDDRLRYLRDVEHVADKVGKATAREEAKSAGVVGSLASAGARAARVDRRAGVLLDGIVKVTNRERDRLGETAKAKLLGVTLGRGGGGGRAGHRQATRPTSGARGGRSGRVAWLVAVDAAKPDIADHLCTPITDRGGRREIGVVHAGLCRGSADLCFHLGVRVRGGREGHGAVGLLHG